MASYSMIAPLCGSNYATWKLQCKMSLLKDNLWSIVSGSETLPANNDGGARDSFNQRRDKALAIIVLAVDPSLLYILGDPEDCMGLSAKTISKEIVGKQTEFASKIVRIEARGRWIGPRSHQRHHRDI